VFHRGPRGSRAALKVDYTVVSRYDRRLVTVVGRLAAPPGRPLAIASASPPRCEHPRAAGIPDGQPARIDDIAPPWALSHDVPPSPAYRASFGRADQREGRLWLMISWSPGVPAGGHRARLSASPRCSRLRPPTRRRGVRAGSPRSSGARRWPRWWPGGAAGGVFARSRGGRPAAALDSPVISLYDPTARLMVVGVWDGPVPPGLFRSASGWASGALHTLVFQTGRPGRRRLRRRLGDPPDAAAAVGCRPRPSACRAASRTGFGRLRWRPRGKSRLSRGHDERLRLHD